MISSDQHRQQRRLAEHADVHGRAAGSATAARGPGRRVAAAVAGRHRAAVRPGPPGCLVGDHSRCLLGRVVGRRRSAARSLRPVALAVPCQALGGDDQLVAVEGRPAELGEDLAADQHDDPVADLQVGQLVGAQQHARAARRRHVGERAEQQFLGRDVHAAGRRDRDDERRAVRERPRDGDLLLVAAGQLADRLAGPRRHQGQPRGRAAPRRRPGARGRSTPSRPRQLAGDGHRDVLGDAEVAPRSPRRGGPPGCSRSRRAAPRRGGPAGAGGRAAGPAPAV